MARILCLLGSSLVVGAATTPLNVLFIVNDDLRPMIKKLHPDKFPQMVTPNFDELMADSLTLKNSHVQFAECGPSRASFMFGRRPDSTKVYDLYDNPREIMCATCKTIPQIFTEAGYTTVGMGKLFHDGHASNNSDPISWTDFNGTTTGNNFFMGEEYYPSNGGNTSWMAIDETVTGLTRDSQVRDNAIEWMRNLTKEQQASSDPEPFFLGVGFRKPHLPFIVPKEFYDMYPEEEITLAANPYAPRNMPTVAYASWELQSYGDVEALNFTGKINETLVDWKAREEVRGYQAALSYTDHNVGMLVQELKDLGIWDSTVIMFAGDHGWKLGNHGAWCKHTNFRDDTNSPVMLRIPGLTDGGFVSNHMVEHVDMMATLADAAGIDSVQQCDEKEPFSIDRCTEGTSFVPLARKLANTRDANNLNEAISWKNASYSQYIRGGNGETLMGYSMTTDTDLRFTAWVDFDVSTNTTEWKMDSEKAAFELYNHTSDGAENVNIANDVDKSELVADLFEKLKLGWRATVSEI